jgi:hypothetical protein
MAQASKRDHKKSGVALKLVLPLLFAGFFILMSEMRLSATISTISSTCETQTTAPPSVHNDVEVAGICQENPYAGSLHSSLDGIRSQAKQWLEKKGMDSHLQRAAQEEMKQRTWDRFFPFEVMAACNTTCVGAECRDDKSKIVCGIEKLQTEEKCVVYSVGGNNQWQFELDILEKTPCEVHTFDCTGNITRFQKPKHPRLSFHHICLGAEHVPYDQDQECSGGICGDILTLYQIQIMLGHKRIDLFKVRCHSIFCKLRHYCFC